MSDPETSTVPGGGARHAVGLLSRVVRFALSYWRIMVVVIVLTAVYSGANSLRLLMIGLLFDGVVVPAKVVGDKSKSQLFFDFIAPVLPESAALNRQSDFVFDATSFRVVGGTASGEGGEEGAALDDGRWQVVFEDGAVELESGPDTRFSGPFQRLTVVFQERPEEPRRGKTALIQVTQLVGGSVGGVLPILIAFGAIMMVLALVIAVSNFFKNYLTNLVVIRTVADIRERLFRHFSTLSLDYFGGSRRGDLISRLTNDVGAVQFSLRYVFGDIVQQPMSILFCIGLAFFASWQLTLLVLPFLPLLAIPMLKAGRKVKKHGRGSLSKLGEVTETLSQFLSGIRVVKAFGMESAQQREFADKNAGFIRSSLKMVRHKSVSRSAIEGLYNLLAAVVLIIGGWLVVGRVFDLNLADFAVFLGAVVSMYQPLRALAKAYNTVQESLAGAERVFELLEEKPTVQDREGAQPFPRLQRDIVFENVSFRYGPDEPWVLRDVTFRVERGQTIALVGPSGSGKSTLIDLLARFYDVDEGRILLDGRDLCDGTHESLLAQIAYVGQDPFLFHSSIAENLRHGRSDASDEDLESAACAAAIHDEIAAMPGGYDTIIGERGQSISGGQRQRVTIARALLKDADILLLDEATSALDTESERKVQEALEHLMEGRTTFVIAHRLSTIRHADRILVLTEGRLMETGTHEELLAHEGIYARLLEMQGLAGGDRSDASPTAAG